MKITAVQREYYRYTGFSAEVERSGRAKNPHDFTRLAKGQELAQEDAETGKQ